MANNFERFIIFGNFKLLFQYTIKLSKIRFRNIIAITFISIIIFIREKNGKLRNLV